MVPFDNPLDRIHALREQDRFPMKGYLHCLNNNSTAWNKGDNVCYIETPLEKAQGLFREQDRFHMKWLSTLSEQ